jgi:HlyD family secretion protein
MERVEPSILTTLPLSVKPAVATYRRLAMIAAALAFIVFAAVAGYRFLVPAQPIVSVTRGLLVQTIVASGRVHAPQRVDIGSRITGGVAAIPVREGQTVKAGDTLIVLDAAEAQAGVAQAQAAVLQARGRLRQLRDFNLPTAVQAERQAEVNLENARRQYDRNRQLNARGFMGQSQLDDARRAFDTAQSQRHSARLQVATNAPGGSDYALAQAALRQAEANLRGAQSREAYTLIRSPVDGTLIARDVERGDVVQPGKALMVLSPSGATQLVAQIDERNLASLKLGQHAVASADAYPDQRFAAELVYINPGIDAQRGSVEARFDVQPPPAYLRQDMTVSIDVEVARRQDAMVVPMEAVHYTSTAPWAWKYKDGRIWRQPLRLGVHDAGRAEVLGGLQPGDRLALGTGLHEGQHVRVATGKAQ